MFILNGRCSCPSCGNKSFDKCIGRGPSAIAICKCGHRSTVEDALAAQIMRPLPGGSENYAEARQ